MPSREENRKAAKELLARCAEQGVKVPTNPVNAAVEAGTMLNATREKGEFCLDAALQEMIKKFGLKEPLSPTEETKSPKKKKKRGESVQSEETTATRGKKRKSEDVEDEAEEDEVVEKKSAKKPRKAEATCQANQKLADAFAELSGFEFKRGERFKGGTWSKVAKAIRDCDSVLTCGKEALKLKGVGKSSAAKIDEFLETGTLETLEEYRAGNM
uniref:Crossover junction endonuclease MUS81-like HHH domain-containing protein n=1 Tax=Peronospora matthiolae TaxID=2874970 RepID=A0AAV1UDH8_9STRA